MIGFIIIKWKYPIAPLVIGLILGPMTESNLRKSLMMFRGNLSLFFDRPIAMGFLSIVVIFLAYKVLSHFLRRHERKPL